MQTIVPSEPKRRGRPKVENPRDLIWPIRLNSKELEILEAKAKRAGKSGGQWMRETLLAAKGYVGSVPISKPKKIKPSSTMKPNKSFFDIFEQTRQSDSFWEEGAILSFTDSVVQRLEALGLTKKNLADKLGVSPAYVTKLIGGSNNFTLRTMVKIARQLKCELNITLRAAVAANKSEPAKAEGH